MSLCSYWKQGQQGGLCGERPGLNLLDTDGSRGKGVEELGMKK